MNIVHWIKDGGKTYCVGPKEEMDPEGIICDPQPDPYHEFDMKNKKWVYSPYKYRELKEKSVKTLLQNAQLAWMFCENTEDREIITNYIHAIMKCMQEGKGEFPCIPACIQKKIWEK